MSTATKGIAMTATQTLPSIGNYGTGQANTTVVDVGQLTVYFSYTTPIAFTHPSAGLVLSENCWGPTTGKHLNWIGRDLPRVPRADFERMLAEVVS
jgi:hypothetical protein